MVNGQLKLVCIGVSKAGTVVNILGPDIVHVGLLKLRFARYKLTVPDDIHSPMNNFNGSFSTNVESFDGQFLGEVRMSLCPSFENRPRDLGPATLAIPANNAPSSFGFKKLTFPQLEPGIAVSSLAVDVLTPVMVGLEALED